MSAPDDAIPEPASDRVDLVTGEVVTLPPEQASRVIDEIKAVAESRGDVSHVHELVVPPTGPIPIAAQSNEAHDDDQLSIDELRDAWPLLDLAERGDGLRVLQREDAEEFFIQLPARDQADLLLHFRPGQRRQWMRMLEPDDVADLIQQGGEANRKTLLALLDDPTRKEVVALLKYAEDEAGGLMSTRYARLRPEMSADEAVLYLRRQARAKLETIYVAYVLDPAQRLLGVVSFRDLFAADSAKTVAEIMVTEVVRVSDEMDQETVSRVFAEHDLNVVPVVDEDGKMKGIVTVDDIVDVVQEEATEDAQKFGGLEALDMPYLESTRREMFIKRGKWLALLLVGEMFTTLPLGFFEDKLHKVTLLALFLPLIVSGGGNSGSQASTLIIRAMALDEIRPADWWLVLRRELLMGLALGGLLGAIAAIRVVVWGAAGAYSEPIRVAIDTANHVLATGEGLAFHATASNHVGLIGLTVAIAVAGCVTWGTLSGAMLPFLLKKIGADPASASAPLVATIVDVSGIAIYLTAATLVLTGVLL